MSLLFCAVAALEGLYVCGISSPLGHEKSPDATPSPNLSTVKELAIRIFQAQLHSDGPYSKRIQGMIDKLPENARTVEELVYTRIRVLSLPDKQKLIRTSGTDHCHYIYISKGIENLIGGALPWLAARELYRILEQDYFYTCAYSSIASISAAALACFVLQWSLLPSLALILFAKCAIGAGLDGYAEIKADEFANRFCLRGEVKQALEPLETCKKTLQNAPLGLSLADNMVNSNNLTFRIASLKVALEKALALADRYYKLLELSQALESFKALQNAPLKLSDNMVDSPQSHI